MLKVEKHDFRNFRDFHDFDEFFLHRRCIYVSTATVCILNHDFHDRMSTSAGMFMLSMILRPCAQTAAQVLHLSILVYCSTHAAFDS